MPRPSQQIDLALLASGRALFPRLGCAGLTVRAVAEHAGANPAMFHYHFGSKDAFLQRLLQQMYEELYAGLASQAQAQGAALQRLRAALLGMAHFAREHRQVLARVWMDAMAGEAVAGQFFRTNAPRHLGLLFGLLQQAQAEGTLRELPPLQRLAFVMGSVLLPIVFIAGLADAMAVPQLPVPALRAQVMSYEAIAQRVDLALAALGVPGPGAATPADTAPSSPARRPRRPTGAPR